MNQEDKPEVSEAVQKRANRHLLILNIAMVVMVLLPIVLYLIFIKGNP